MHQNTFSFLPLLDTSTYPCQRPSAIGWNSSKNFNCLRDCYLFELLLLTDPWQL